MSNLAIRSAFHSRVLGVATALSVPVAWEGVEFKKPTTAWLEPFIVPSSSLEKTLKISRTTFYGWFQVNIWVPAGKGTKQAETIAQSIIDAFPVLPKSGVFSVETSPTISPPLYESGWLILPVMIKYRHEQFN